MSVYDEIRKEYQDRGLDESQLADDPFSEFAKWFDQAIENSPGRWAEPNAMTLSTSDATGSVTSRIVLLKQHNRNGLVFFTNYGSEKGTQLEHNPNAALLFHWAFLGQQIRINGSVSKSSREVSQEYFHSRPRGAQIGAVASAQSSPISSRQELADKVAQLTESLGDDPVPLPETWGGYCLVPNRFEFWQGRTNRLHDRIQYCLDGERWSWRRLSP